MLHNISLLRDILDRPSFLAGNLSTDFLNEEYQDGFKGELVLSPVIQNVFESYC